LKNDSEEAPSVRNSRAQKLPQRKKKAPPLLPLEGSAIVGRRTGRDVFARHFGGEKSSRTREMPGPRALEGSKNRVGGRDAKVLLQQNEHTEIHWRKELRGEEKVRGQALIEQLKISPPKHPEKKKKKGGEYRFKVWGRVGGW